MTCTQSFSLVINDTFIKIPKMNNREVLLEGQVAAVLNESKHKMHIVEFCSIVYYKLPHDFRKHDNVLGFYDQQTQTFARCNRAVTTPCSTWKLEKEALLLSSVVKDLKRFEARHLASLYTQAICLLFALQHEFGFMHGDFHSGNVFVVKTDLETVKFEIRQDNWIEVPTYGYTVKIFDFGRSILFKNGGIEYMNSAWIALNENYVCWEYDEIFDICKFLDCVSSEIREYRSCSILNNLLSNLYNLFNNYSDNLLAFNLDLMDECLDECEDYVLNDSQHGNLFSSLKNGKLEFEEVIYSIFGSIPNIHDKIKNKQYSEETVDVDKFLDVWKIFFEEWMYIEKYLNSTNYIDIVQDVATYVGLCDDNSANLQDNIHNFFLFINGLLKDKLKNNIIIIKKQHCESLYHSIKVLQEYLAAILCEHMSFKSQQLAILRSKLIKECGKRIYVNEQDDKKCFATTFHDILEQIMEASKTDVVANYLAELKFNNRV